MHSSLSLLTLQVRFRYSGERIPLCLHKKKKEKKCVLQINKDAVFALRVCRLESQPRQFNLHTNNMKQKKTKTTRNRVIQFVCKMNNRLKTHIYAQTGPVNEGAAPLGALRAVLGSIPCSRARNCSGTKEIQAKSLRADEPPPKHGFRRWVKFIRQSPTLLTGDTPEVHPKMKYSVITIVVHKVFSRASQQKQRCSSLPDFSTILHVCVINTTTDRQKGLCSQPKDEKKGGFA